MLVLCCPQNGRSSPAPGAPVLTLPCLPSLDRLSRSLAGLIAIVGMLRRRGVGFKSLPRPWTLPSPGGWLVFHVFAVLAEFICELIIEGIRPGAWTPPAAAACASADRRP